MSIKKLLFVLAAAVCTLVPCYAYAASESASDIASGGGITYRDGSGWIAFFGEDIALLEGKIASISSGRFDPAVYSHVHQWKYIDVNGRTHSKHCDLCGAEYDVTNVHTAETKEPCEISYGGAVYDGYRYQCECGYQWEREITHIPIYTFVDETEHTVSCALNGTAYCNGMTEHTEEHDFDIIADSDNSGYHICICSFCGYSKSEPCDYIYDSEDPDENLRFCICGRYHTDDEDDKQEKSGGQENEEQAFGEQGSEMSETDDSESRSQRDENPEGDDLDDRHHGDEDSETGDSSGRNQENENSKSDDSSGKNQSNEDSEADNSSDENQENVNIKV